MSSPNNQEQQIPENVLDLLNAFRHHYHRFENSVRQAIQTNQDTTVLSRIGDELDEYLSLVEQYSGVFPPEELQMIQSNVRAMQHDIRLQYSEALDASHHGRPEVIQYIYDGNRGRPSIWIDPDFLAWAVTLRSTSSIARFLGVGRTTVRNALLDYGIMQPQVQPQTLVQGSPSHRDSEQHTVTDTARDELLDPIAAAGEHTQAQPTLPGETITSFTSAVSDLSDDELDSLVLRLRGHYRRAGVTMLRGMLRRLGHTVPRERIRCSLIRIDPVHRVFDRIRIRRRSYSVPGPNSLWHHDGQHGLIRWGIIIHGFIDGYSRLITGLRASNNNRGETVLDIFLCAAHGFGVPSRLRGDHGVENLQVAAWMEQVLGECRGSYIWGRSIHNIRIERLWVDITAQIGATWAQYFTNLEIRHGLDINNIYHIWLLHYLFLPHFNDLLVFFAQSWNQHVIQIRDGRNRSPADMFGFDMLVAGVRGYGLPDVTEESMAEEEIEVFGVDWEGLQEDTLLESHQANNQNDRGSTSWIGRRGPPEHLNEVPVHGPNNPFSENEFLVFQQQIQPASGDIVDADVYQLWSNALNAARDLLGNTV